jgi:hypothetical protein
MWLFSQTVNLGKGPYKCAGRIKLLDPGRPCRARSKRLARSKILAALTTLYLLQESIATSLHPTKCRKLHWYEIDQFWKCTT